MRKPCGTGYEEDIVLGKVEDPKALLGISRNWGLEDKEEKSTEEFWQILVVFWLFEKQISANSATDGTRYFNLFSPNYFCPTASSPAQQQPGARIQATCPAISQVDMLVRLSLWNQSPIRFSLGFNRSSLLSNMLFDNNTMQSSRNFMKHSMQQVTSLVIQITLYKFHNILSTYPPAMLAIFILQLTYWIGHGGFITKYKVSL